MVYAPSKIGREQTRQIGFGVAIAPPSGQAGSPCGTGFGDDRHPIAGSPSKQRVPASIQYATRIARHKSNREWGPALVDQARQGGRRGCVSRGLTPPNARRYASTSQ